MVGAECYVRTVLSQSSQGLDDTSRLYWPQFPVPCVGNSLAGRLEAQQSTSPDGLVKPSYSAP